MKTKKLLIVMLMAVLLLPLVACSTTGKSFTVSFNAGEDFEIKSSLIQEGAALQSPAQFTLDGYTITGWYEAEDFSGDKIEFPYSVTESVTLYAKWEETPASGEEGDSEGESDLDDSGEPVAP